jgi:hypothetical protein
MLWNARLGRIEVTHETEDGRTMTDTAAHGGRIGFLALLFLVSSAVVGPADACEKSVAQEGAAAAAEAKDPAEAWGIKITSIRLSANNHMIDYRYRVLDADKATDLFKRQIKPHLIHQKTEKVLSVPETAKLGPLRNSNTPQAGKIYWMFFGNAGQMVKAGDKVTVVIGDFRVENLMVE